MRISELLEQSGESSAILNEVHWTDMYPANFQLFRKKYLKLSRQKKTSGIYVQFSNYADNTIDRTVWQQPDHHDPVGVYAYPIDYVLNYPADIWYGQTAKYLRVLQETTSKTLYINHINSEREVERLLRSMGFSYNDVEKSIAIAKKSFKKRFTGSTAFGKLFLTCVQLKLTDPPLDDGGSMWDKTPTFETRTGVEQTALFRKLGIDAIIDTSTTNKQAVINDREPEQIVFLNRNAFRVLEVYNLRWGDSKTHTQSMTNVDPSKSKTERKLASQIAAVLNDKIKEYAGDEKIRKNVNFDAAYHYYWTVKGRRILVEFDRPSSYYSNKKFGEKKHRADKLSSSFMTTVQIQSEIGNIKEIFGIDYTFDEIVQRIANRWHDLQKNPQKTDWQPQDAKSFAKAIEDQKQAMWAKRRAEERTKNLESYPEIEGFILRICEKTGLPFTPLQTDDAKEEFVKDLDHLSLVYKHYIFDNINKVLEKWITSTKHLLKAGDVSQYTDPKYYNIAVEKEKQIFPAIQNIANIIEQASKTHDPREWLPFGNRMFELLWTKMN